MENLRGWRLILLTGVIVVFVAVSGYSFDRMLHRYGVSHEVIAASSNLFTGAVVAGLFLQFTRNAQSRRRALQARLEIIADMNHHIRNALQILSYGTATHGSKMETEMMQQAIRRIEWALHEVLPGYSPETHVPHEPAPQAAGKRS
jgi:hypothetical protein